MVAHVHCDTAVRCALFLGLALAVCAQEPRFDVRSRLVFVPVNVSDAKNRPVDGLEPADFLVLDNGQPRKAAVDSIDTGVAPIALIVAVQASGISAPVLDKVRKVGGMIQPLVTGERGCAGVLSFAERVKWIQDCSRDADEIGRAFQQVFPEPAAGEEKAGCMLDAVQSAVERLSRRQNARRVLLLISESRDRGSEADLDTVASEAQAAGVAVYAATYSAFTSALTSKVPTPGPRRPIKPKVPLDESGTPNGRPPGRWNPYPKRLPAEQQIDALGGAGELARRFKDNTAEALAESTGGAVYSFRSQKDLENAIHSFGNGLHSQYVLSFAPDSAAGPGYHRLEVRLTRPGEFRIRARPGYWSGM